MPQYKVSKEPELAKILQKQINDYVKKGYIRELTPEEINITVPHTWYLPIFPVFNPNKPGKVRLVWDAAVKSNGVSLNSFLLKGPDQLVSLQSVLFKFRERKIAVCADIEEMFFTNPHPRHRPTRTTFFVEQRKRRGTVSICHASNDFWLDFITMYGAVRKEQKCNGLQRKISPSSTVNSG